MPPAKPIELHKRHGTYNATRHGPRDGARVTVAPVGKIPDFDPAAVFEDVLAEGVSWLAITDSPTLAMLRSMMQERRELRVLADGTMEARRALRELDKSILSCLGQLGFDPTARSRLGLAEVKAEDALEKIKSRRDKRRV
jgi:hypothetical protein